MLVSFIQSVPNLCAIGSSMNAVVEGLRKEGFINTYFSLTMTIDMSVQ